MRIDRLVKHRYDEDLRRQDEAVNRAQTSEILELLRSYGQNLADRVLALNGALAAELQQLNNNTNTAPQKGKGKAKGKKKKKNGGGGVGTKKKPKGGGTNQTANTKAKPRKGKAGSGVSKKKR